MKKLTGILFLLLPILITSASPAYAENWVKLSGWYSLDTDSVKVDGQYVEYWIDDYYEFYFEYWVSDCTNSRLRVIKYQDYFGGGIEYPKKSEWWAVDTDKLKVINDYVCKHYYRR